MEPSLLDIVIETANRAEPKLRDLIAAVVERM
jgi:hypothetical protein